MNMRQRVINVINKKPVDMIPYSFDWTRQVSSKLASHYEIPLHELDGFIGDHLQYYYASGQYKETLANGNVRDEFGILWDRSGLLDKYGDWGDMIKSPLSEPTLESYVFPSGANSDRLGWLPDSKSRQCERYCIVMIKGLFTSAWQLRGFQEFLTDMLTEDAFTHSLLDKVLQFNLEIIAGMPSCVDGIRFDDDWGQQEGLLMGPVLWRKFLKPRLKVMYAAARKRGFNVFIHSCGDISEIFREIVELGVEVVHPMQPETMDVEIIKHEYGKDIVLYGGIGCQSVLPNGTVDDVIEEAKRRVDVLGKSGGYIFGPAGAIPTDAKIENVIALTDFARSGYKEVS